MSVIVTFELDLIKMMFMIYVLKYTWLFIEYFIYAYFQLLSVVFLFIRSLDFNYSNRSTMTKIAKCVTDPGETIIQLQKFGIKTSD